MSLIKSSDLSNWYERLNAVRNKSGINLGDETVETVSSNEIINLNVFKNLYNKIDTLKSNKYLAYADFYTSEFDSIDKNTIISENDIKSITDTLSSLESICANNTTIACQTNSTNVTNRDSTNTTCKTNSTDSTNRTCGTSYNLTSSCGTCSTCDTVRYTDNSNLDPGGEYYNHGDCPTACSRNGTCSTSTCDTSGCYTIDYRTQSTNSTQNYRTYSTCKTYTYKTNTDSTYTVKPD